MADEVTRLREEVAKLASQFDAFFSAKEEESKAHGVLLRELVISVERNHTEQKEFVSKQLEGLATGLEMPEEQYKTLIETANGGCWGEGGASFGLSS